MIAEELALVISKSVIDGVSQQVTDRCGYPHLVASALTEILKARGVQSRIFYGKASYLVIGESGATQWVTYGGGTPYFWIETDEKETIDLIGFALNSNAGFLGPPLLWAKDYPSFYRFVPEGIAEFDIDELEQFKMAEILNRVRARYENLKDGSVKELQLDEPLLLSTRRVADNSSESFKRYQGIVTPDKITNLANQFN